MEIIVRLDEMMARRKMRLHELAARVGITEANLSILKNDKAKAIRFSTLAALCKALHCQPGDLFAFVTDNENELLLEQQNDAYVSKDLRAKGIKMGVLIGCILSSGSSIMTSVRELHIKTICALRVARLDSASIKYDYQMRKLDV